MSVALELILIAALFAAAGSVVFYTLRTGITPNPSSRRAARAICDLLESAFSAAEAHASDSASAPRIYELGSGFGTLAIRIARRFEHATVVGVERSPIPRWCSRLLIRGLGVENVRIERGDFLERSLRDADAVVCYLFTGGMATLAPKLSSELTPGKTIVSHAFELPGWKPKTVVTLEDLYETRVYLYER